LVQGHPPMRILWQMRYDPANDLLGFVVRHADLTISAA